MKPGFGCAGRAVLLLPFLSFLAAATADGTLRAQAPAAHVSSPCAATAEAAALQSEAGAVQAVPPRAGFRLVGLHTDPLRGRSWALVQNCADRSKPLQAVALREGSRAGRKREAGGWLQMSPGQAQGSQGQAPSSWSVPPADSAPLVHAGDFLRVVSAMGDSQIELQGQAVEPGGAGAAIGVRLAKLSSDAGEPARVLRCRVAGPGLAEVLP